MADQELSYFRTYQRTKAERRAEIGRLQRSMAERKPTPRFILALFFGLLGSMFLSLFPPIGGVFLLVAFISASSGLKLMGVAREVRRALEDENYRWNLRDIAMSKLGPDGFETLGKAVAGGGSYASVTAYMKRKGLDDIECDVMILAASAAAEDMGIKHMGADDEQKHLDAIAREEASWKADSTESDTPAHPGAPASEEGLHAKLLAEERLAKTAPDEIQRKIEAARAERAAADAADADHEPELEGFGR